MVRIRKATAVDGKRVLDIWRGAFAFSTWRSPAADFPTVRFAAAPLAELVAAHRSTRIVGPLLGRVLAWKAAHASNAAEPNPPDAAIAALRSRVWAEAGNATGGYVAPTLKTGEGYRAAAAAVRAVELQMQEPRVGALTPVQAFGSSFALLVPGTRIQEI
jgi:short subunit dehydrogenase-like uncharacterized protein